MIARRLWHIRNKWRRHQGLTGSRTVRRHIPATSLLSGRTLARYLGRYREVYVKPVYGSYGNRIMKLTRSRNGYLVNREQRVRRVGRHAVRQAVFRYARSGRYLIQRGVPLLRVGGRPVDFRVLLLRPNDRWELMGVMGKQASGNRIVTNYSRGGKPLRLEDALRSAGWTMREAADARRRMARLSMAAAEQFVRRFPHCRRMGVDIAVDANKRLWILEVNTNPQYELFRHHANRALYGRIHRIMRTIRAGQSRR